PAHPCLPAGAHQRDRRRTGSGQDQLPEPGRALEGRGGAGQMSARIRRLRKQPAGLDITAFMNLIVVLVPFLLTTPLFSRLPVLELTLPAGSSGFENLQGDLPLDVLLPPHPPPVP